MGITDLILSLGKLGDQIRKKTERRFQNMALKLFILKETGGLRVFCAKLKACSMKHF